jgi:GTP cyclohydrolase I
MIESGEAILANNAEASRPRIVEQAVAVVLGQFDDPERDGLVGTPGRVARAYEEMLSGYAVNLPSVLATTFDADGYDEMVICRDIDFVSLCEHHMLPFVGRATIGYIPGKRVVGISKLPRLVQAVAKRLQIQERMTAQIASTIDECLQPKGVGVIVEARHLCMTARGVKMQNAAMITQCLRGLFREDGRCRGEFLDAARERK